MSNNGGNLTVQYNLRWSEELRDKIAEAAKENTRSMNQEIIARLEQSFEKNQSQESEISDLKNQIAHLTEIFENHTIFQDRLLQLVQRDLDLKSRINETIDKKD